MNEDTAIDELVRRHAVVDDATVEGWDLESADVALREHIVATRRRPRARAWTLLTLAASVLAALALVVPGLVPSESAYAADVLASAKKAPRLLIDDSAWSVKSVNDNDTIDGSMVFTNGTDNVTVSWYKLEYFDDYVEDRLLEDGITTSDSTLLGNDAVTVDIDGKPREIFGKLDSRRMLDIRLADDYHGDEAIYSVVMKHLEIVDPEEWLDALPDSIFTGDRKNLAIDEMLEDIPIPSGYDATPLKERGFVSNRYHLGTTVVKNVGCAWFSQWFEARESGDSAAEDQAQTALEQSRSWAVLNEMAESGAFPQMFWSLTHDLKSGTDEDGMKLTWNNVSTTLECS